MHHAIRTLVLCPIPASLLAHDEEPVQVEIVNERVDVRVDPRTRSYTLQIFAIGTHTVTDIQARNTLGCRARIQYPDDQGDVRPGGANTNVIAAGNMPIQNPPTFEDIYDSRYVPVPNMFIGKDVDLELVASAVAPRNPSSTQCFTNAYVHLIPAVTGTTPPGGGGGISGP